MVPQGEQGIDSGSPWIQTACPMFTMDKFVSKYITQNPNYIGEFNTALHKGYKLCLEVNAAGKGRWAGKYISVGLHLMRGDFGDELSFPFYGEITVQIVGKDNCIAKVFIFDDKTKKAGARADQNMNKESCDIHDFVTVKDINQKFLRNGSIVFRVVNIAIKEKKKEEEENEEENEEEEGEEDEPSSLVTMVRLSIMQWLHP